MIKNRRLHIFLVVVLIGLMNVGLSIAQTKNGFRSAFVGAGEQSGQAILFTHGNECFAITPAHVIDKAGGDLFDVEVQGTGNQQVKGIYKEIYRFDAAIDLSLGVLSGSIATDCGAQFGSIAIDVDDFIKRSTEASIHVTNSQGELSRIRALVESSDHQFVFVSPEVNSKQIIKGMSGGLIAIENNPVGMLLTGDGRVLRMDRISELVNPFLKSTHRVQSVVKRGEHFTDQSWLDVKLSTWTGESIAPDSSVQNLINYKALNPSGRYMIKRPDRPAEITFSLPKSTEVSRVQIIGFSLKNSPKLLKSVEVMVDPIGTGRWRSVSHGDVSLADGSLELRFQPAVAQAVLLRLFNNWGDANELGFDKIYFYSK